MMNTNYKVIDRDKYYRKGVFRHFSEDCNLLHTPRKQGQSFISTSCIFSPM